MPGKISKEQDLKSNKKLLQRLEQGAFWEKEGELIFFKFKGDLQHLYLEITSCCNLECITCPRRQWPDHKQEDMEMEVFQDLLLQLERFPNLHRVHLGGFGEPLCHPFIEEIVNKLTQKGYFVSLSTNGTLLTPQKARALIKAGIGKIIFSLDSSEENLFRAIRVKGELEQVKNNIRHLREAKKALGRFTPKIGLEYVLMRKNIHQLRSIPALARELGASWVLLTNLLACSPEMYKEVLYEKPGECYNLSSPINTPPVWDEKLFQNYLPENTTWPVSEEGWVLRGTLSFPRFYWGSSRTCSFIEQKAAVIRQDGEVAPCYALMYSHPYYMDNREKKVSSYSLGNIQKNSFFDIWNTPEYLKFRHRVRNYNFPSCMDCLLKKACEYALNNEDCWGSSPSCADCLWSQGIIRCP